MCDRWSDPSMHDIEEDYEPPEITLSDIAADEGLPVKVLREALRQSHPEASVTEVIWRAHQIEEGA